MNLLRERMLKKRRKESISEFWERLIFGELLEKEKVIKDIGGGEIGGKGVRRWGIFLERSNLRFFSFKKLGIGGGGKDWEVVIERSNKEIIGDLLINIFLVCWSWKLN